jgi:fumarate reductase subunit D
MPPEALDYSRVLGFAQHWIGKLLILAVISLFLFHAVHRIYHGLHDLGVHAGAGAMVAAYGSALLGTVVAAVLLLKIGF